MGTPGGLADCSVDYQGGIWYNFDNSNKNTPPDWQNHVGYLTDCWGKSSTACNTGHHTLVGIMERTQTGVGRRVSGRDPNDLAYRETRFNSDKICPATAHQRVCGWAGNNYYVCKKNETSYTNNWQWCCKNNNKWSPKNNCNPFWYNDNGQMSPECSNLCLGKTSYTKTSPNSETLKNDYENGLCIDALRNASSNLSTIELRDICSRAPFYINGEANPLYNNICGCFYPDEYYDSLKEHMKERFPNLPDATLGDKTCYSTACANSDLKGLVSTTQCPDVNFLECVNNLEFNVESISGDGTIAIDQKNDCNVYTEEFLDTKIACGSKCENDDGCPTNCPCSENKVCENKESVPCEGNYTCPSNKKLRPGALCRGDENSCNEDCCFTTNIETPIVETPNIDTPSTDTPSTDTPSTDIPSTDTPSTDTPSTEMPITNTQTNDTYLIIFIIGIILTIIGLFITLNVSFVFGFILIVIGIVGSSFTGYQYFK